MKNIVLYEIKRIVWIIKKFYTKDDYLQKVLYKKIKDI